jgi:hypothetical protein
VAFPIFHVSGLQHQPHQAEKPSVVNAFFQQGHEFLMVDVVKEAFDGHFDEPFDACPRVFHGLECRVA